MSRLATLAQAMSSTSPTMHISTINAVEKSFLSGEYPRSAWVTSSRPFMNWVREYCDHSLAAGSVIS